MAGAATSAAEGAATVAVMVREAKLMKKGQVGSRF